MQVVKGREFRQRKISALRRRVKLTERRKKNLIIFIEFGYSYFYFIV